ncbi:hypothetical protein [Nostoc sp.]|uniref:hypothetical protein n=1 Tax=Nostoc sp. TaxID=1180 RepID=UPI002FF63EA4
MTVECVGNALCREDSSAIAELRNITGTIEDGSSKNVRAKYNFVNRFKAHLLSNFYPGNIAMGNS